MHKQLIVGLIILSLAGFSCTKKSYCPGLGQQSAADLSQFDEDGNLKEDKKNAKQNKTGLVNKKEPKAIHKKRKRRR